MGLEETRRALGARIGEEIHVSDWMTVDQELVDQFAQATGDRQWIHTDPERAAAESPYGGTIAHGYLTLALYPLLRGLVDESRPLFADATSVINYGLNKLRFPSAVRVGSRIRARCELVAVEEVKGSLQLTERYTVEIENAERPACVAECIMRVHF